MSTKGAFDRRFIGRAMDVDDLESFERLLKEHPEALRREDGSAGWMGYAARDGQLRFVESLVRMGIGVDESDDPDNPDHTPLVQAAANGHVEVVRWLLDHGAKVHIPPNPKSSFRFSPLTVAAMEGHLDVVKLLVEHNVDLNEIWNGSNALMQAEM